ncbi:DUF5017 domain-containing protein [Pedobacter chitinilyticus]|uniref:DUF5017 domain-containing protein n=1 Tax=Pedobacter chitinilyticus TaxID=2233776 RepID=A0A3S3SRP4_9SPHI|nr:DUF5017 domain-containing protein [Pedobacter chitinilyticus]RWU07596.1 DUF5017 domain-containing protein [Pedobacter chitinilyticus]
MNKLKYILGLLLIPAVYACKKDTPDAPTFNVVTSKAEYNLADSVEFQMSGYADVIGFYSGEAGKEYRYRNRLESDQGKMHLNIQTQVLYGTQANNLSLLYSTDFDNIYSVDGISKATWKDITNRFTLSTAAAGAVGTAVTSADVDLSDLPISGKPIFFAFKWVGQASTTAALGGRTWRVPAFNLTNKTASGTSTIATVTSASWLAIDVKNTANKWTIQSTTPFLYFAPNSTLTESEDWAVSKALFPNKVSPDVSVNIKAYTDRMKNYKYKFSKAGVYTVTFIAKNGLNGNVKEVVKELTVTIK